MTKNIFYINGLNKKLSEKKFLAKKVYNKNFIRNNLPGLEKLKVIDTESEFRNLILEAPKGSTVYTNKTVLRNKFNPDVNLQTFLNTYNKSGSFISYYEKKFTTFTSKNRQPTIVLKPVKGGYSVYCAGTTGFLPKSQYKKAKAALRKKEIVQHTKKRFNLWKLKRFFPPRLPLKLDSMSFCPGNTLNNFSKSTRRKTFPYHLNTVFVYKPRPFNNNEKEEAEEDTRMFNTNSTTIKKTNFYNKRIFTRLSEKKNTKLNNKNNKKP